jgi:hypothetical protein
MYRINSRWVSSYFGTHCIQYANSSTVACTTPCTDESVEVVNIQLHIAYVLWQSADKRSYSVLLRTVLLAKQLLPVLGAMAVITYMCLFDVPKTSRQTNNSCTWRVIHGNSLKLFSLFTFIFRLFLITILHTSTSIAVILTQLEFPTSIVGSTTPFT